MKAKFDPKTCDLSFARNTVYTDIRNLGGNVYRDIKMSLMLGTSSDLIYHLKKYSNLLAHHSGNEVVELLAKGMFSSVYLVKDQSGEELVVKRSHDGWMPLQVFQKLFIPIPRPLVGLFFSNYGVSPDSLKRDVYDYEKILRPFWGEGRAHLEGKEFMPYLNMALYMVDHFLPVFSIKDIYSHDFWNGLLNQKEHKKIGNVLKYLKSIPTQKRLIPEEERYILYDTFSHSLQTIIIQEAIRGRKEVIPGHLMAYPCELIAAGVIPYEMPKLMIEHILRAIESFVKQLDQQEVIQKIPDYRPIEVWKIFPPTPYELCFAETNNIVVYKKRDGKLNVTFVDTHLLLEPEGSVFYKWVEIRFWISIFLNLRFWLRKALDYS
jgi:hypothetical protein